MVSRFWLPFLLAGLLGSTQAMADIHITLKADKHIIALGEPLTVELKVEGASDAAGSINFDKLKQNFNVYGITSATQKQNKKSRSINIETITLTLYPLRTGKLNIPALHYKDKHSNTLHVTVLAFNKQLAKVIFRTTSDNAHPLVRQEVTLTLDIYDDGTLQWTVPHELAAPGAHQRRLAESQSEEMLDGVRYTLHRYAWALMPLRDGRLKVEFAMMDAFKFGTRLRYPVAPLSIDVATVPAYLPVYVPVGKPVVSVQPLPTEMALQKPVNWKLIIQGNGISAEGVRKLLSSVRSNDSLSFYPATVSTDDSGRVVNATQALMITLPFVPVKTGKLKMPDINLPYFDPAASRVESLFVPGAEISVFNPVWTLLGRNVIGLLLMMGISGLLYGVQKTIRSRRRKQQSLLLISHATSMTELQLALLKFEISFPRNLTLRQWLCSMQKIYFVDDRLTTLVQKLESALYGDDVQEVDISSMAHTTAALLKSLRKRNNNRFEMPTRFASKIRI